MKLEYFKVDFSRSFGSDLDKDEYMFHDELDYTILVEPCIREEAEDEFFIILSKMEKEYNNDPDWRQTASDDFYYEWRNDNMGWVDYLCERIPLGRPGAPGDLEGPLLLLASDASQYITGQTLLVDGGISVGAVRATTAK